ncbi:hypothetical protein [Caldifermentibacillus hisashii]|uniref:hypothetical protein n=1 Tax=Caldifermentibacillus hisashii TaxID=996558 RepID=UPI0034D52A64
MYEPGKAIKGGDSVSGSSGLISGQPIVPATPLTYGTFIIPNAPPVLGHPVLGGTAIQGGQGPNGGTAINGGQGPNSGTAINGGQGPNGGTAINGGEGPNGGTAINGGQGPNGGTAINGGQSSNGGSAINGGQGPNGGTAINDGQGPNGGTAVNGGQGLNGGTATNSGQDPNGGTATGRGQGPSNGNTSLPGNGPNTSDSENETSWLYKTIDSGLNLAKTVKRWGLDFYFAGDSIAQGIVAHGAGYKFVKNEKYKSGHKYKYLGNRKVEGKFKQKLLDKFSSDIKDNKRNYNSFERKQYLRDKGLLGFKETFKKSIRDKWFPFFKQEKQVKMKGHKVPKIESKWTFNKDFIKPSKLLKGNGFVNTIFTFGQTLNDYTLGPKKSKLFTSEFFADLSTDATIGIGTTFISSVASSAAVGAVGGSVVPGLGTAAGAAAGLLAGIGSYFIMESRFGKSIKKSIRSGFKKAYDGIGKAGNWIGSQFKSGLKKIGGIFG